MKMFNIQKMKYFVALILVFGAFQVNAETKDPEENFFQKSFGDFGEELELAKEQGKIGIMMMFEQDECPFCFRMRTTILNQSHVQEYFRKHFAIFHIDIEGDTEMVDFSGKEMPEKDFAFKVNRVRATPVLMFYDLNGNKIVKYTGPTSSVDEFMLLGKYVIDKQYLSMSFSRYKQNKL